MQPRVFAAIVLALAVSLGGFGCTQRAGVQDDSGPSFPKTYNEIEQRRVDLRPLGDRTRKAMERAQGEGMPSGGITTLVSFDKTRYRLDEDEIKLTLLWVNNTPEPIRVCRRLLLDWNFRPLILLNDEVQVLYNLSKPPDPPTQALRPGDFMVIPPFGEQAQVVDLKNLPRFGLMAGQKGAWSYNLTRPGLYRIRLGLRSVPLQLVPEHFLGDPTARTWEGSTLSNSAAFEVVRR